ncbi:MAG: MMPL family transporter [Oligoflexia bacterium]|nr:MMPL family transporter [Oligoflexia bacterium]
MAYQPKPGLVSKFIDFVVNKPKTSLIITAILVFAFLPGLASFQQKYDVRIWFRDTDPLIQKLDDFEKTFGNDESVIVTIKNEEGIFNPTTLKKVYNITEELWRVPQVLRVETLANYNYSYAIEDDINIEPFIDTDQLTQEEANKKREIALNHEVLPGYLVSKDGKSVMMFARLVTTVGDSPNYEVIIQKVREIVKKYEDEKHEFHIVGEAAVNDAFREIANNDGAAILPFLFLLIIAYLIFVFRSVIIMILPLAVTVFTVCMSMGLCFYIGFYFNNILAILPAILISISIADSVHILVTYFQFKGEGLDNRKAAYYSLHKNFVPTFMTSVSTMIGFLGLTMTELMPIRQLGYLAGFGCFAAWIISIFMMGPVLAMIDFKTPKHFLTTPGESTLGRPWSYTLAHWINNYKNLILIFFFILGASGVYFSSKNNVNSNPFDYFTDDQHISLANDFIKENFGGSSGPEIIISSGKPDGIKDPAFLAKVEKLKNWINEQNYVNKTVDIIDIIKDTNRSLNQGKQEHYVIPKTQEAVAEELFMYTLGLPQGMDLNNRMSLDYEIMRMSVLWNIYDTRGWLKHVDLFLEKAKEFDLNAYVTGKFYLFQRMMDYVVFTFFKSVTMALFLVALLMMIVFKSVKIGLLSLIPNVLPLILGGSIMYLTGIDLNIGSALVASVCLGIAVDDTIHFLANYYRLKNEGHDEIDIMASIFTYTGSALVVTTMILASGFGLYMFGDFVPNINFGLLCAVVLTMALIIDLIFLPALLLKFAKK